MLEGSLHFGIYSFVQVPRNFGGFLQVEKCAMFWKRSQIQETNFSITCIILFGSQNKFQSFCFTRTGVIKEAEK